MGLIGIRGGQNREYDMSRIPDDEQFGVNSNEYEDDPTANCPDNCTCIFCIPGA